MGGIASSLSSAIRNRSARGPGHPNGSLVAAGANGR
jgi:hypothetical protein